MDSEIHSTATRATIMGATFLALCALVAGFWIDSLERLTQPTLFYSFLVLSLCGILTGWQLGVRNDPHIGRRVLALSGGLLAWRLSWFPLMVVAGWQASLGEWLAYSVAGTSIVYPTFLMMMFLQNLGIGWIAAAAVAKPQTQVPHEGRLLRARRIGHSPPRKLLWVVGALALPVAFLTSFSRPEDLALFVDGPWSGQRQVPPISEPRQNPYAAILEEHYGEMSPGSLVLAANAAVTYPLVPESPWGGAMKGTLEALTRANPMASSTDRIVEHYLAYIAAHERIRGEK